MIVLLLNLTCHPFTFSPITFASNFKVVLPKYLLHSGFIHRRRFLCQGLKFFEKRVQFIPQQSTSVKLILVHLDGWTEGISSSIYKLTPASRFKFFASPYCEDKIIIIIEKRMRIPLILPIFSLNPLFSLRYLLLNPKSKSREAKATVVSNPGMENP